jgi:hypothetical protein
MNHNKIKYRFTTPNSEDHTQDQEDSFTFFYQVCMFPDPRNNNNYHMKKFIINSSDEIVRTDEYFLTKKQCKQLFAIKKKHEYKCYPVYSLKNVIPPSLGEILGSKSDILNNSYDYSGYAPFSN